MPLSLRRSIQDFFVVTDGYSAASCLDDDSFTPSWSLEYIRTLKHEKLIEVCAGYFEEKGYRAKFNNQHENEYIDVWLFKESYSSTKPFGMVKCWETKAIDVEAADLDSFLKIKIKNPIPLGVFITVGKFSENLTVNKGKKIKLIDGEKLFKMITSLSEIRNQRLLDKVTQNI